MRGQINGVGYRFVQIRVVLLIDQGHGAAQVVDWVNRGKDGAKGDPTEFAVFIFNRLVGEKDDKLTSRAARETGASRYSQQQGQKAMAERN